MEPAQKKRGLLDRILGRSVEPQQTPPPSSSLTPSRASHVLFQPAAIFQDDAPSPFESPAKRASEAQMANRKVIGRPHASSAKMGLSMEPSSLMRSLTSTPAKVSFTAGGAPSAATPRRMPGDNPNKPTPYRRSLASSTPMNGSRTTNFSGASTLPRNFVRSGFPSRGSLYPAFSTRAAASPSKSALLPDAPGKSFRASTTETNGHRTSSINSGATDLFNMRIPSPPRQLTGEAIAREVPSDHSKPGSIYADEFLAHYCPPDFDELQRRQFFCVLDLRRLKYAADEIFLKKDWKINVMNFAKEFEKSRSLILVRYGMYDFKTKMASGSVKKAWQEKHGIPDSEDDGQASPVSKAPSGAKRKAEEELSPEDVAPFGSHFNTGPGKRPRLPLTEGATRAANVSNTGKRKAQDMSEPENYQPAKLQKSAPSQARTLFESVANKTAASSTPAKATPPGPFSHVRGHEDLSNGDSNSILFGSSKSTDEPKKSPKNPFAHLPQSSKEGEDEEAESEDEDEEPKEAAQASNVTSDKVNGLSAPSAFGPLPPGRSPSLFDRITRGDDGKPVRKDMPEQKATSPVPSAQVSRLPSPTKDQSAAPTDKTWTTDTPIKFAPTPASAPTQAGFSFGSRSSASFPAPKPAPAPTPAASSMSGAPAITSGSQNTASSLLFGAPSAAKTNDTPSISFVTPAVTKAEPPAPTISYGTPSATASASPSLFGAAVEGTLKPAGNPPLFGTQPKSGDPSTTTTTSSIFGSMNKTDSMLKPTGSTSSLFGQPQKDADKSTASEPSTASSLFSTKDSSSTSSATTVGGAPSVSFGAKPSTGPGTNIFQSSTLFGAPSKAASDSQPESQESKPSNGFLSSNLFGVSQTSTQPSGLFGAKTVETASSSSTTTTSGMSQVSTHDFAYGPKMAKAEGSAKRAASTLGDTVSTVTSESEKPVAATEPKKGLFGASIAAQDTKSLFGNSLEVKPAFGSSLEVKSAFGSQEPKSAPAATATQPDKAVSIFAKPANDSALATAKLFSFGATDSQPAATQSTMPSFGTSFSSAPSGGSSFTFTASGSNPFATNGSGSAAPSFNFGGASTNGSDNKAGASLFQFGGSSTTASQQSTSNGPAAGPLFSFGSASSQTNASQPNGPAIFSSQPATTSGVFGTSLSGGPSTGTSSPFNFGGGASSLATTPAASTPEPAVATVEAGDSQQEPKTDGEEQPQEQISLTAGGPGEEDEDVVFEVRAKALKYTSGSDDQPPTNGKSASPWKTMGIGPLRVLKNKTTGAVRAVLRAEPRGNVVLNKVVLPKLKYKNDNNTKYIIFPAPSDDGKSMETWMIQVKTSALAKELSDCLEASKAT